MDKTIVEFIIATLFIFLIFSVVYAEEIFDSSVYKERQMEMRNMQSQRIPIFNPQKYSQKELELTLSKTCQKRLDELKTRLIDDPENKFLNTFINLYISHCKEEAKKFLDKTK